MSKHISPHWKSLLDEFELDWRLSGLAPNTATEYVRHLHPFLALFPDPTAMNAKQWLEQTPTAPSRRYKARAIRRFAKWLEVRGDHSMDWWNDVPLAVERPRPQATVTLEDYLAVRSRISQPRDAVIIELLWCTGMRRSELARAQVEHFNLAAGILTIPVSKTGKFRTVPLSPDAMHALMSLLGERSKGSVTQLTSDGLRSVLRRLNAPPAHAWRRGWAVHALRNGVSEVSVRTIAGWSSGAMVARYTAALSNELAVVEFERLWRALD
jgi:integrase